ncbi:SDR family NAD(P)-dependent oxidoreductase [Antrihabitans sp. YC2-6]|uniref:SDR family NAD(P)-dependent oxidoreductase n=1 Tax=Antrihabitans sp. YC2-6 TaxID=2799498 RepID=UPI0018F4AFEA|nr:SDR family NAD(P)-dependent oxidoreductase [Antrihabitans sp. YC2-6]MBJ8344694.1 SDR family NAD(P)-dependent oxidoreductase [Antrihabitans sp. YC2-6]
MKLNSRQPRVVVVTGAGSGIGRATAIRFARAGAHVVASDLDLDTASSTVAMIRAKGHNASPAQLDVTDPEAWEQFALDVHAEYGVPDVLVNNAGIMVGGAFVDLEPKDWDLQLRVNLMGVVHGCRTFGKLMIDGGAGGHIVNIASAAALTPIATFPAYSVSKAGVKMLSECLRLEFGPKGIGVSAICPGVINTNIGKHATLVGVDDELVQRGLQISEQIQEFAAKLPFSPMSPDLVARAAQRAVRYDLAVVPVRTEAWLGYFMGRIAPGVNRNMGRAFTTDRLEALGARILIGADR